MSLIHVTITHLDNYQVPVLLNVQYYRIVDTVFYVVIYFLYPISGLLADVKLGRYKTIVSSIWMVVIYTPLILIGSGLLITALDFGEERITYVILITTGSILAITGLLILLCSIIAFGANVIQFGLDQLHDSPAEDQIIFIQWYMWLHYVVMLTVIFLTAIFKFSYPINLKSYYYTMGSLFTVISIILIVSVYIAYKKKKWFMINKKLINPYKLVYLVTNLQGNIKSQSTAVPLLTVRMRCLQDWTLARPSMEDPLPQNKWRMSKSYMG